ncbi:hypothetical protein LTR78_002381 [Recurvomyces mirabilis]|uniref:Indoleamine 2,3-dioxygenase n=1 Tax=Recurvomyces mirabilis TaxID=574656 RepID=A0AAE0WTK6_9PEZI|nr:hypothetical protein LTR78_002381 [Recurvomyces mirabilis]KAK5157310.1 hypothetical protein LTS14_004075 [Recurvomyces mirabilis]
MSPYMSDKVVRPQHAGRIHGVAPHLDEDPALAPNGADPFTITTSTGFMPLQAPMYDLPAAFKAVSELANAMPVTKLDGTPGLLSTFELGPRIDNGALLNLTSEIDNLVTSDGKPDLPIITAVFRDYAFLASAYILEPCWQKYSTGLEGYGLGRQIMPACLAGPLVKTANLLGIHPFMAYAAAYSLYNFRYADPDVGTAEYDNLRLIRAFEHGLDPKSSEAGFILTHVDMVKHSSGLVDGSVQLLDAVATGDDSKVANAFELLLDTMHVIEESMETMWTNSRPKDYISYRTFIFGITNQSMFPDGVIYEGENDNKPMSFRGESGANDSIIPLLDSLLQIPMPSNPLTEILKDFRSYRPKPHREFLAAVRQEAEDVGVRSYCSRSVENAVSYLKLLDHVRSFRWRHWMFTREYIIRRSSHPTATGGSPIIRWLPNQLFAVMDLMDETWQGLSEKDREDAGTYVNTVMQNVKEQHGKLQTEVERWCAERAQ